MGISTTFVPGQWNAICDRCGGNFKSGELRRTWQGFMVCAKDWEPRHPQDFVRGVKDDMTPQWTRPRPVDIFTTFPVGLPPSEPFTGSAVAGVAVATLAFSGVSS